MIYTYTVDMRLIYSSMQYYGTIVFLCARHESGCCRMILLCSFM